jgi:hypothetical protein
MHTLPFRFSVLIASLLASCLMSMSSLAAQQPAPEPAAEEIIITGQRSILKLRQQLSEAEDVMYEVFNEINTDDIYDIRCSVQYRYHSHLKEKRCVPRYALDAMELEAKSLLVPGPTPTPLNSVLGNHNPKMEEKLKQAAAESPEFYRAMARHYELRQLLDSRRDVEFNDDE